ncbi:MAG: hypothetical protein AB1938_28575 [Myxococcota bacterium]
MRWLLVILPLAVAACATTPKPADDVVPGQLLVGTEAGTSVEALPEALAVEGYTFQVVSSATDTNHLVKVEKADGTALSVDETKAVLEKLSGRKGVRFVEVNRVRQPR